jgi:streptomycin 6-kinase
VLVHGDPHQRNALESSVGGFRLIDPDGLLAEAECDVANLMREDPRELLRGDPDGLLRRDPGRRARRLARHTGLDAAASSDWSALDGVSTGLRCAAIDLRPSAENCRRSPIARLGDTCDRTAGAPVPPLPHS